MKGQAFVGLPSEKSAEKALRDTNGYVLYDKPLVVVSFLFSSPRSVAPPRVQRIGAHLASGGNLLIVRSGRVCARR